MGAEHSKGPTVSGQGIPFIKWNNQLHFAEPSSYTYVAVRKQVIGEIAFTDPPKADGDLLNAPDLMGKIAIVERGGRWHFPDIMRKLFAARVIGCIFIERAPFHGPSSIYEGFHSSGRQRVSIPILRLSKFHADQLLQDEPARVEIGMLNGQMAIEHMVPDDIPVGIAVSSRNGEIDVLTHLLKERQRIDPSLAVPAAIAYSDAIENGYIDCIETLHEFNISMDEQKPNGTAPIHVACSVGNVEAIRALLVRGADAEIEDAHGMRPIMIATRNHKPAALKFLIRKGVSLGLSRNRTRGTTALHIAAQLGAEECLEILINAGSPLDIQSPSSSTALMEAARSGSLACVRLLVEANAKIDAKDREGNMAENIAANAGHEEISDFLRSRYENVDMKDQRRSVENLVKIGDFSIINLLTLAHEKNIDVDVLKREILRNEEIAPYMKKEEIIHEVFRLLGEEPVHSGTFYDLNYGDYQVQYFCSEIAMWYQRDIFEVNTAFIHDLDQKKCFSYFRILFNFVNHGGQLDNVLVVLLCKVIVFYILERNLGSMILAFFGSEGATIVPNLVKQLGHDLIKDMFLWLLYSDLSTEGQKNINSSGIFSSLFTRLNTWQRTLTWGVGTKFQRDTVENICSIINYIIYPPAVSVIGNIVTFVDNVDNSLPLITGKAPVGSANNLFKTLLENFESREGLFGLFITLGLAELNRQIEMAPKNLIFNAGTLSITTMIMSTLGYHKTKRDTTGISPLLDLLRKRLTVHVCDHVKDFVVLGQKIIAAETTQGHDQKLSSGKTIALFTIITFLKRSVFMQSAVIDNELARSGCMPYLLSCYTAHPTNNLLHHELTDVIRFILLDPAQMRSPSCPLLNSLFAPGSSVLECVIESYTMPKPPQYRGHMTTVANSIITLASSPGNPSSSSITAQELVKQYVTKHPRWKEFENVLAQQNHLEQRSLGQTRAPLCDGCLALKEHALKCVKETLDGDVPITGHLETIFDHKASHHCQVNVSDMFISGFVYKKDKKHDHIPIPEPSRASSFVQYPVPMPFHALTFTITFVGICQLCDKLWYCDTLHLPNWSTRMKWVMPTSVRNWYSFGTTEGPGGGAHGIWFSTRGYKNFMVVVDTWGRQEQWIHSIQDAIQNFSSMKSKPIDWEGAMAIEIDNEYGSSTSADSKQLKAFSRRRSSSDLAPETPPLVSSPSGSPKSTKKPVDLSRFKPPARTASKLFNALVASPESKPSKEPGLGMRHVMSTSDLQKLEHRAQYLENRRLANGK